MTGHSSHKKSIQTPLARARGLGSAHHGSAHWLAQRVSAVALIPLVIWFMVSVISLRGAYYDVFIAWLSAPLNAILMILLIGAAFYHAMLGLQVVIEDYIHCECMKMAKIIGIKLALTVLAVASIFSILKVAL